MYSHVITHGYLEQRIQYKIGVDSKSTFPPQDGNSADSVNNLKQRIKYKVYIDSKPTSGFKDNTTSNSVKITEQQTQYTIGVDSKFIFSTC